MRAVTISSVVVVLLAGACGSASEPAGDASIAVTTSVAESDQAAEPTTPSTTAPLFDGQRWVDDLLAARVTMNDATTAAVNVHLDQLTSGAADDSARSLEASATLSSAIAESRRIALETMPDTPDEPAIAAAYEAHRDALAAEMEAHRALADAAETDAAALVSEFESAGVDLEAQSVTRLAQLNAALEAAGSDELTTCFVLSDALASAGLDGFSCTGSTAEDLASGQATAVATDPFAPPSRLEAGSHDFSVFDRPFEITLDTPIGVRTAADVVEFVSQDNDELYFYVLAVDSVVDPVEVAITTLPGEVPISDDLATWVAELPATLNSQGTSMLGNRSFEWWDIISNIAPDPATEAPATYSWVALDQFPNTLQIFEVGANRIWHRSTPSGPVLVFAHSVIWSGVPHEDLIAFVESTLAGATFE